MVHQNSIVQWMDLDTKDVKEMEISRMFGQYIARANRVSDNMMMGAFKNDRIKITDWKGWSQVLSITRESNITEWYKLTTKFGTVITAAPCTEIMIYNPDKMHKGFHGESKYEYVDTTFRAIEIGDVVRVRHTQNSNGYDVNFDSIESIEHLCTDPAIGYHVKTKSGFYNCSDFYISAK